jgi:hypothetical protein
VLLVTVDRLREGVRGCPTEAVPIVRVPRDDDDGRARDARRTRRRLVERVPACPVEKPE